MSIFTFSVILFGVNVIFVMIPLISCSSQRELSTLSSDPTENTLVTAANGGGLSARGTTIGIHEPQGHQT